MWSCLLDLGTVVSSYHLCELSAPRPEGEEKERLTPNRQKTHADMQTQPERGQQEVWLYVTNPQVSSNEHTHCNGKLSLNGH